VVSCILKVKANDLYAIFHLAGPPIWLPGALWAAGGILPASCSLFHQKHEAHKDHAVEIAGGELSIFLLQSHSNH
jgi:hypothetical protein